jgi:hypothetical protein
VPIGQVTPLGLGELLGSLLGAVVTAQQQSSRATLDFVEEVGFERRTAADGTVSHEIRSVALRYRKRDENGQQADFEVDVPLLALVNPPALAVSEATLTFNYDILSVAGAPPPPAPDAGPGPVVPIGRPPVLRGVIRRRAAAETPKDASLSVDVTVTLRQEPPPVGVARLLDLAELGITESRAPQP